MSAPSRLGIYGGSFDPVHNAHLAVARASLQQAELDEVWFVPTAVQPLKHLGAHASNAQRIAMLKLAIEGEAAFRVSTIEVDRGGVSYTVETLRQISEQLPQAELFFVMGADALRDVPDWREPDIIFHLATPLVVRRGGEPEPDLAALARFGTPDQSARLINLPPMEISSSEIRRRIATGARIDHLVPASVAAYIAENSIYQAS